jgi:Flp pilus assembly protein TadG
MIRKWFRRTLVRALRDQGGNTAMVFAMALPVLGVVAAGGMELTLVVSDRSKTQDIADAAALAGAKELNVSMQQGAAERARAFAEKQLADVKRRSSVTVNASVLEDGGAMQVVISTHRASLFGNMLPPGGFTTQVTAVAERLGKPLCVLATKSNNTIDGGETGGDRGVKVRDDSIMTAGGCMVYSNTTINVDNKALLSAGAVQSVEEAKGRIQPVAQVGAQPIEDPFTDLDIGNGGVCQPLADLLLNLGLSVTAGTHCGDILVGKGQTLQLAPGMHYFKNSELKLEEDAKLVGRDVVLVFDKGSKLTLKGDAKLDLEGRKTGNLAGFVIVTTPKNDKVFEISSTSARKLLGTVYIPGAKLLITGEKNKVADSSPWTVIVAQAIEMKGSPDLVINSNYDVGSVPVPTGVGPTSMDARLAR